MKRREFLISAGRSVPLVAVAPAAAVAAGAVALQEEPPLEPALPIVDAHHHLWDFPITPAFPAGRYLLPDLLDDIERSGHAVTQTTFVECHAMYRADGPEAFRPVGEVEFANGVAAMAASGRYGPCRVAAGIVGTVDLRRGAEIEPVLDAMQRAADGRFRGVRIATAWTDAAVFGQPPDPSERELLGDPALRTAGEMLGRRGLVWDVWVFHTQLAALYALARTLPDTTIVIDHAGTPFTRGRFDGRDAPTLSAWRARMRTLAELPNVRVKLGGLGMDFSRPLGASHRGASSEVLAREWRPIVEWCIEAFGVDRCMFESNFPPDAAAGTYGAVWNAFKRITMHYSKDEKAALFGRTCTAVYRV